MFQTCVASVLSGCCVCLQYFSSAFSRVFASVSHTCFKCFIYLLLYVASIASGCFKSGSGVAHGMSWEARGARACPAWAHDAGDVQVLRDPTWAHKTQAHAGDVQAARAVMWTQETGRKMDCSRGRSSKHPGTGSADG